MKCYRLRGRSVAVRNAMRSVKRQRIPIHLPSRLDGTTLFVHRCVHRSWIRRIAKDFGLRIQLVESHVWPKEIFYPS